MIESKIEQLEFMLISLAVDIQNKGYEEDYPNFLKTLRLYLKLEPEEGGCVPKKGCGCHS